MVALVAWPRPAVTPVPADTTVMSVVAVAAPASVPHLPQSTVPTCAPRSKVTGRGSLAVLARPVAARVPLVVSAAALTATPVCPVSGWVQVAREEPSLEPAKPQWSWRKES